jgi:O-antigen/teichoic acid export membrane protein
MAIHWRRLTALKGVSFSLLDQAILSVANLLVALAFIRYADKAEYFTYSQLLGLQSLNLALQAAFVGSPALTLLPRLDGERLRQSIATFQGLQILLGSAMACVCFALVWRAPGLFSLSGDVLGLACAFGLLVFASWAREYLRTVQFIRQLPHHCFQQDLVYVTLLLLATGWMAHALSMQAEMVFLAMGICGLLAAACWAIIDGAFPTFHRRALVALWGEVWPLAKWALPATLVAWTFSDGFLYVGGKVIGAEGMADVVAARLFVSPLNMAFVAWGNVFRPKVSRALGAHQPQQARSWMNLSLMGVIGLVVAYAVAAWLAFPLLESRLLGDKYVGLGPLIGVWLMFSVASGASAVCNGVLLAGGHYQRSFVAAAMAAVVSLTLTTLLGLSHGKQGLLMGVVLGEFTFAAVLFWKARRALSHHHEDHQLKSVS